MSRASRASRSKFFERSEGTFHLQITSMVDMFTILLVFLLKGYSTSAIDLAPSSKIVLPSSTSMQAPKEAVKMVISKEGIYVEDRKVASIQNDMVIKSDVDATDPSLIRPLYQELDKQALKTKEISGKNNELEFEGLLLVQADKSLPYNLLKRVMYTSMMAGYADVRLAVLSPE